MRVVFSQELYIQVFFQNVIYLLLLCGFPVEYILVVLLSWHAVTYPLTYHYSIVVMASYG